MLNRYCLLALDLVTLQCLLENLEQSVTSVDLKDPSKQNQFICHLVAIFHIDFQFVHRSFFLIAVLH